jgi:hypothetical protein
MEDVWGVSDLLPLWCRSKMNSGVCSIQGGTGDIAIYATRSRLISRSDKCCFARIMDGIIKGLASNREFKLDWKT